MKLKPFRISVAPLITLTLISGVGLAFPASAADSRFITVSASGSVSVVPDAVRISAMVSILGTTSKNALSTISTTSSSVRSALIANKIATKDISTQSIAVYPEYSYPASGTPTLLGFRATQSFDITIRSATTAGAIIEAIVEAGENNLQINGVSPFVLDSGKASETARADAVRKAKAKAASYAKLLGVKLGRVIYLDETIVSTPSPVYSGTAKSDFESPYIDLGEQKISIVVTARWMIF